MRKSQPRNLKCNVSHSTKIKFHDYFALYSTYIIMAAMIIAIIVCPELIICDS